jgi:hypothetical protein
MTHLPARLARTLLPLLTLAALAPSASAAAAWAGVDLNTSGFGARAGLALLPVPFIGTLGIEAGAGRGYAQDSAATFSAGLTLRDLNLPLTKVDAFGTVGAEFAGAARLYAEAGLRGPLLGPAGWRVNVRGRQDGVFSGGVGLELRF